MKAKASIVKQEAEIEATENEIKAFFNGIIPDFVKQSGGILSDTVRFWRWKNKVSIISKTQKVLEKNGLGKQKVPLKILVPLLEGASLEEEESMQVRWANLLANAVSGSVEVTPSYVEILKELSPTEVLLLDRLYSEASSEPDYKERLTRVFDKQKICAWLSISSEKFDLMIENLFRLNLCRMPGSTSMTFGENMRVAVHTTDRFEFTTTGFYFVKTCKEPNNEKS